MEIMQVMGTLVVVRVAELDHMHCGFLKTTRARNSSPSILSVLAELSSQPVDLPPVMPAR